MAIKRIDSDKRQQKFKIKTEYNNQETIPEPLRIIRMIFF